MKALGALALLCFLTACKAGPRVQTVDTDEVQVQKPASNWEYKIDPDSTWACTKSVDDAAKLCFRKMQGKIDSYISLPYDGGMFFCYAGRCQAKIRVDAGAVRAVDGTDDENGNTRTLFLPAPATLLHEVEGAREVKISPPMFGKDRMFVFEVAGLKWP